MTRRHWFYDETGEQVHESFAIDAADCDLFAADTRAHESDTPTAKAGDQ